MKLIYILIVLLPLFGSAVSGLFCRVISNRVAHTATIIPVAIAAALSLYVLNYQVTTNDVFNENLYTWMSTGNISVGVGFLIDNLTAMMMVVVTSVSLLVHIFSVGYMKGDEGYNRFFSYISLFTFSMLMLVMSNNFMQLFFGWEAVGLVSYLLIGFWYKRPTAIFANMKAFLVNRVGDFGFLIGIAAVVIMTGALQYDEAFVALADSEVTGRTLSFLGREWDLVTFAAIFLFIGAMGKSAQVPLHVWLPDSMEGPTPISALIHAATMVTAGIFMVSRMSPLFELSSAALSFIIIIGSITALFMGILGIFQNDIKRVVAYSTISQLGYMTVALGASAYSLAAFHLTTHAFFKALLFLGAGSVIIGMCHGQDMRYMGGLRKYMPITWITTLIGALSLVGTPFFSGFYSKESIVMAVGHSEIFGSGFASFALQAGIFITAFYTFRMYFMVFHGKERFTIDPNSDGHTEGVLPAAPKESPFVVWFPLVALAVPSVVLGLFIAEPMITGTFLKGVVSENLEVQQKVVADFGDVVAMVQHGLTTLPLYLTLGGVLLAWFVYTKRPQLATSGYSMLERSKLLPIFENNYYFDKVNQKVFAEGSIKTGRFLWQKVDDKLIDQGIVYGSSKFASFLGGVVRKIQTGYLYHSAFLMIIGLLLLMSWVVIFN